MRVFKKDQNAKPQVSDSASITRHAWENKEAEF